MSRILIVIVNYRADELVGDCLRSLATEIAAVSGYQCRVIVTDNASADGSAQRLGQAIERNGWTFATVMELPENGGFAYGNNAAIRSALAWDHPPDYVMMLNPDTLVKPGAVGELADFLAAHSSVGIVGSSLLNGQGECEPAAHRAFTPWTELDDGARLGLLSRLLERHVATLPPSDRPQNCDWVSGASFMVRREVFTDIGLMDDGYFLYFDEVDFCLRAKRAGWGVWHVPASVVVHLEGSTTQIAATAKRRPQYWFDSRRRYYLKSWGAIGLIWADLLWAAGRLSLTLRRRLGLGGDMRDVPPGFAGDLLLGDLRAAMRGQWNVIARRTRPRE